MKSNPLRRPVAGWAVLCLALGVPGCGYFGSHSAAGAKPGAATSPSAAHPAKPPSHDDDMVTAASVSKGEGPITLKFALRQRPEVGQPAELDLEAIPNASVDRVTLSLRGDEGLTLSDGAHWDAVERPEVGVPFTHSLTVVPSRDGVFSVLVTVLTDTEAQSLTRSYMIPVVAGSGITPEASPTPAPVAAVKSAESSRAR